MKVCIASAVALGLIVTIPIASFAAGDNDKSASSAKATVHHKKPKTRWSDTVHENASNLFFGIAPAYEYGGSHTSLTTRPTARPTACDVFVCVVLLEDLVAPAPRS